MEFHEKVHAFLVAQYHACLTEQFQEQGEQVFIHATRYYGEQRGRRMAQRALRDGQPLTYETYCRYGEWVPTQTMRDLGEDNRSYVENFEPDLLRIYTQCPWHTQFFEMGAQRTGQIYCRYLDSSICRGFNPDLVFLVEQSLNEGCSCIHRIKNAGITKEEQLKNNQKYVRDFEYHCAHLFWSFQEICIAVFGQQGQQIADCVLEKFAAQYGTVMAERLLQYRHVNFHVAGEKFEQAR